MIDLMIKYDAQGKADDAIRVGQEWLKSHPEDDSIVYTQIAKVYLGKASGDATHRDEWIRQAVAYIDKDLWIYQYKGAHIDFDDAGLELELAGDLSTADSCLYYGRALKAFADEEPSLQGEALLSTSGVTIPLAPLRQRNEESKEKVQAKFAKAGCK